MSESKRLGKHTEQRAGEFLFQKGDLTTGQYLDMRTRINMRLKDMACLNSSFRAKPRALDSSTTLRV